MLAQPACLMHIPAAMRILLLTETLHAGGAETFVLRLARALRRAGEDCEILNLTPEIENAQLVEAFPDVPIKRIRLPALAWLARIDRLLVRLGVDFSLQAWLTRREFERRFAGRYDVYHSNLFKVDLLLARAKQRFPRMACVSTLHGDYNQFHATAEGEPGQRIVNWRDKVMLVRRRIDAWVYITGHQLDLLERHYGFGRERFQKIYNGYELPVEVAPAPARPASGGLRFIMVARGIREKGWEILIRAFLRLDGGSRLSLVGEGPDLDDLRRAWPDERIEFLGFHPNPPKLVSQADVFVFPSRYVSESLPTVVTEAIFCGVPVIATPLGEIPVMIEAAGGELCGQLLEDGTDAEVEDRLVEAMRRYLEDPDLLDRHRRLTASAFQKFDMAECTERYRALYRSTVEANPR
jgi:glycosyltransferase involved in cell wall biosynthesis